MKKNYDRLFKIDTSENNPFSYAIYRRNFFDNFKKVATVKIVPTERITINYIRDLKNSEQEYLEKYFDELSRLKIEPDGKYTYIVYRQNSSNVLERVALAEVYSSFYRLDAIQSLKTHEIEYLRNYFRNLM